MAPTVDSPPSPMANASVGGDERPEPRRWGLRFAVGLVLVAVSASAFAIGFRVALAWAIAAFGGPSDVVSAMRAAPIWARVAYPCIGGLLAGALGLLVQRDRAGQGVGDVMEAVVLGRVRLSMRVTLLKSLASFCAIVSGGSLGREGPLIQFGGAAGGLVGKRLGVTPERTRLLIAAGAAAGFAAAYNTPFAAILFVLEVVTGVVVLDAIAPALVATTISVALTRAVVGEGPIYGARAFTMHSPWEYAAFAGLGLLTAVGAQGFMRLLTLSESWFKKSRLELPIRPMLGGALAGSIVAWLPEIAGNGYEPLNEILDGRMALLTAALILVGKPLATAASVSSGCPGGVFTPTLLMGGALGALYARGLAGAGCEIGNASGYALVGMAAAIAATTHAPLMAAVMVFELSGNYAVALPLILATAIAVIGSRRFDRHSIYTAELRRKGIDWELTMEGRRIVGPPHAS